MVFSSPKGRGVSSLHYENLTFQIAHSPGYQLVMAGKNIRFQMSSHTGMKIKNCKSYWRSQPLFRGICNCKENEWKSGKNCEYWHYAFTIRSRIHSKEFYFNHVFTFHISKTFSHPYFGIKKHTIFFYILMRICLWLVVCGKFASHK